MIDVNEIAKAVNEAERMRGAFIDSQEYARDCRFLIDKLSAKEAEIERLKDNLYKAIEALEDISNMDYVAYQGHIHMLYDAKMYARVTLNSIKGGETDATQTSSRS